MMQSAVSRDQQVIGTQAGFQTRVIRHVPISKYVRPIIHKQNTLRRLGRVLDG
jgi:hypothetical protein